MLRLHQMRGDPPTLISSQDRLAYMQSEEPHLGPKSRSWLSAIRRQGAGRRRSKGPASLALMLSMCVPPCKRDSFFSHHHTSPPKTPAQSALQDQQAVPT
jgi:hypothetical protein